MNSKNLPILVIIAPCYNEEDAVASNTNVLLNLLEDLINKNIISAESYLSVIDDGSTDLSFEKLSAAAQENKKLKIIRLAHNFGHQKALLCGMVTNDADIYITIDFDLQDDINVIAQMIDKYVNNDVEVVYTVRNDRKSDSFMKRFCALTYYNLAKFLDVKGLYNSADF